jgi:hypothetical protein
MDAEQLRAVISNPAASPEQKESARSALRALGIDPAPPAAAADPEIDLYLALFGQEPLTSLLDFAGVSRPSQLTLDMVMDYVDAQPQLPEPTMRLLRWWAIGSRTRQLWERIKAACPEHERRAAFEQMVAAHPYLAYDDRNARHRFRHHAGFCEIRDEYATRTYFLPQVVALLNELPEYAFQLRDEVQAFISKQEKRWKQ